MRRFVFLFLILTAMAACLTGCGSATKDTVQEIENIPLEENTQEEGNLIATDDTVTLLQYCDGSITLRFTSDTETGAWCWIDEPKFPLDGTKVDEIVAALKVLGQLQKVSSADDLDAYGLSDPQKYLTLETASTEGTMYIGNQADDGSWYTSLAGYEGVYVIPDEFMQMLSYRIYDMAVLPTLPAFSEENLLSLAVENSEGRIYMSKVDGHWKSINAQVADRAKDVAASLSNLEVSKCFDYLPSKQALSLTGFDAPTAVITAKYLNSVNVESEFTMTLGALRSPEEGYYTTINGDDTIYLIPSAQVSSLLVLLIYAK